MNELWSVIIAVMLVAAGVLAEGNLLRIALTDWREGRRARRAHSTRTPRPLPPPRPAMPAMHVTHTMPARPGVPSLRSQDHHRRFAAACALTPALLAGAVRAQDAATPPGAAPAQDSQPRPEPARAPDASAAPPAPGSAISVQLNLDWTNAYFYRGIVQEDSGLILQPAGRLTVNLYERDDFRVDALLGLWNSFHGQKTGADTRSDFTEYWYEADLIGGFVFTKDKLSLTTTYIFLTSPSDAFETVQECNVSLAYDDTELLGAFALHPYALVAIETGADASDGPDSDTGTYLELGIAPGFSVDVGRTPVAISFPLSIGLSLEDYYQDSTGDDDTFGFAQVGVRASVPLPVPDRYGRWTLNAGVAGLFLGDNTADLNAGDHEEVIGTVGLQWNF